MKKVIVAIRDTKLNAFMNPFVADTRPVALRAFSDAVADAKCPVSQHPEDYDLYVLAEVDITDGTVTPVTPIVHLASATELVRNA